MEINSYVIISVHANLRLALWILSDKSYGCWWLYQGLQSARACSLLLLCAAGELIWGGTRVLFSVSGCVCRKCFSSLLWDSVCTGHGDRKLTACCTHLERPSRAAVELQAEGFWERCWSLKKSSVISRISAFSCLESGCCFRNSWPRRDLSFSMLLLIRSLRIFSTVGFLSWGNTNNMHLETLIHHLYLRRIYDSVEWDMRCWIFTLFVSGSCSLLMIDPVIVGAMAVCLVFSSPLGSDEICAQLSLLSLYLYSQISIWMCESAVCWRFSQSAANGSVRKSQRSRALPHGCWSPYCSDTISASLGSRWRGV